MNMKKKLLMLIVICISMQSNADERDDINAMLKEINYLQEAVFQLKNKNSNCKQKVCFNYQALLSQIHAIQAGVKEYLNNDIRSLHLNPPKVEKPSLTKIKKN